MSRWQGHVLFLLVCVVAGGIIGWLVFYVAHDSPSKGAMIGGVGLFLVALIDLFLRRSRRRGRS